MVMVSGSSSFDGDGVGGSRIFDGEGGDSSSSGGNR